MQQPTVTPIAFTALDDPNGQSRIAGTVTDVDTNERLGDALVILHCSCLPEARETETNAQGLYAFADLPPGHYTVQVLAGHGDLSRALQLPRGTRARVNVVLTASRDYVVT